MTKEIVYLMREWGSLIIQASNGKPAEFQREVKVKL